MVNVKNILKGIWFLLVNILLTGYGLLRKIILPSPNRKGNVLGSVFLWFIDIVERIIAFEKEIFHSSWLIRNRFVKQGLIIVTVFLFLLSSVEWTTNSYGIQNTEQEENVSVSKPAPTAVNILFSKQVSIIIPFKKKLPYYLCECSPPFYIASYLPPTKRLLVLGALRI